LGVVRPRLAGGAGRDRGDRAELLAGEPPGLVELVDAHVDEDAAAAASEGGSGWLPVPLEAGDRVHTAEPSGGHALTESLEAGHEPAPESDLQRQPGLGRQTRCLTRLFHRDADRLLTEDRDT